MPSAETVPAAPVVSEERVSGAESAFRWVQVTLMVVLTAGMAALAVVSPEIRVRALIIVVVVNGLGLTWLRLVRRGHLRLASWALILQTWLLVVGLSSTAGGPLAPATQGYFVVVLTAGVLLGSRGGAITAALCAGGGLALALAAEHGAIGAIAPSYSLMTTWGINAMLLLALLGLQHLAVHRIARSRAAALDEVVVRRAAEAELRAHKDRLEETVAERTAELRMLSLAVGQSASAIFITDRTGVIEYVNPRLTEMSGYSLDEAVGQTPRLFSSGEHEPAFYQDMWRTVLSGSQWRGEVRNRRRDGSLAWDLTTVSPVRDAIGNLVSFVAVQEDITEQRRLKDQLEQMAHYDQLTGLPNRVLFFDRLAQVMALSERKQRSFALLMLDLDGFKDVNDSLGHEAGDRVLMAVGERLRKLLRTSDTAARLGGDEFTVLLSEIGGDRPASHVAQRIIEAMSVPFDVGGASCQIGVSIGIARYPDHASDPDTLVAVADQAMYQAKRGGKNDQCEAQRAAS